MTTHWCYAERLQSDFPTLRLNSDVLYIDGGSVLTSVGSAIGIIAVVRERLEESWSVRRMADFSAISDRTLLRRFKDSLGL